MKQYSNKKRFAAINRHLSSLKVSDGLMFTELTQHAKFDTIESLADTIIHTEKFNKLYNINKGTGMMFRLTKGNTALYKKRKQVFFEENRKLSKEEYQLAKKDDKRYIELVEEINNAKKHEHDKKDIT